MVEPLIKDLKNEKEKLLQNNNKPNREFIIDIMKPKTKIIFIDDDKNFNVVMMDVSAAGLQKGMKTIESSCDRLIKKGTMTEDAKKALYNPLDIKKMIGLGSSTANEL